MGKRFAAGVLALAWVAAAGAGEIMEASCSSCGYRADNLWYGRGLADPFLQFAIYRAPAWREVVAVRFEAAPWFWEEMGVTPPASDRELWPAIESCQREFDQFMRVHRPPTRLEAGELPAWASVASGPHRDQKPEGELELIVDPYQEGASFVCPQCGKPTLTFSTRGLWD